MHKLYENQIDQERKRIMKKLNMKEKREATQLLSTVAVTLRIIDHLIIEAEKNANWIQSYEISTKLLIRALCKSNELIRKAACWLYQSVYHQVDNALIYSVDFDDMVCKRNYSEVYQHSYNLRMENVDAATEELAEEMYKFITTDKYSNNQ